MASLSREVVLEGLRVAARIHEGHSPSEAELDSAPVISLWTLEPVGEGLSRLAGIVVGHPRLRDGVCFTSAVLAMDPQMKWARTVSRWYRLGPSLTDRLNETATPPSR